MPRTIAFLRAINVGGHNVKMEELRAIFEAMPGVARVETFIASGNVIFESEAGDSADLTPAIERALHAALGYEVATFLRTDAEVAAIADYRPFAEEALASAGALNVAFLAAPLSPEAEAALMQFKTEIDDFHTHGREVYWLCRLRQSESTFSNAAFERALKVKATFRGINTVRRLAAKVPHPPQDPTRPLG